MGIPAHILEAKQDVDFAFYLLEFSIRTMCYLELEKVDIALFGQEITILLEQENVSFDSQFFSSKENAILISHMNVGAAFGASAIALDNLFEAAIGQRDPSSRKQVNMLWALIYAVRNAFAHGIANPKWVIKGGYRRKLRIHLENKELIVDLAALDHVNFDYSHIGGFANWLKIKERSYELLKSSLHDWNKLT